MVLGFALACARARAAHRVLREREGGLMSVDTPYKFSCDYSYISIFYVYLPLINHLVGKFASTTPCARAAHTVPRLREVGLMPKDTP